jgi:hypothetical protein
MNAWRWEWGAETKSRWISNNHVRLAPSLLVGGRRIGGSKEQTEGNAQPPLAHVTRPRTRHREDHHHIGISLPEFCLNGKRVQSFQCLAVPWGQAKAARSCIDNTAQQNYTSICWVLRYTRSYMGVYDTYHLGRFQGSHYISPIFLDWLMSPIYTKHVYISTKTYNTFHFLHCHGLSIWLSRASWRSSL